MCRLSSFTRLASLSWSACVGRNQMQLWSTLVVRFSAATRVTDWSPGSGLLAWELASHVPCDQRFPGHEASGMAREYPSGTGCYCSIGHATGTAARRFREWASLRPRPLTGSRDCSRLGPWRSSTAE